MIHTNIAAWAAGLFEGEGTFLISKGVSRGINLTSTDIDVLERLKNNFGGNIYSITKRQSHWKDAWIWSVRGKEALNFYEEIKDFLLERRSNRGKEWVKCLPKKSDNEEIIVKMFTEGKTHKHIADSLGLERSSITKFLNRRDLRRLKMVVKSNNG